MLEPRKPRYMRYALPHKVGRGVCPVNQTTREVRCVSDILSRACASDSRQRTDRREKTASKSSRPCVIARGWAAAGR